MANLTQTETERAQRLLAAHPDIDEAFTGFSEADAVLCLRYLHGVTPATAEQMLAMARGDNADDVVILE